MSQQLRNMSKLLFLLHFLYLACRTDVIFYVFQANGGKCKASAKRESHVTGGAQKNNSPLPLHVTCDPRLPCVFFSSPERNAKK